MMRLICLTFLLLCSGFAEATEDWQVYQEQAKQAYVQHDYAKAIELYEKLLDRGVSVGECYYNLGNCYYGQNQIGQAMLYYQRALRFMPHDPQLNHNIDLILNQHVQSEFAEEDNWLRLFWQKFLEALPLKTWQYLLIGCNLLFFSLLVIAYLKSGSWKSSLNTSVMLFALVCFLGFVVYQLSAQKNSQQSAVLTVPSSAVRSGPSEDFDKLFDMEEAMSFKVLKLVDDWYQVQVASGVIGWLPRSSSEVV